MIEKNQTGLFTNTLMPIRNITCKLGVAYVVPPLMLILQAIQ